MIPVRLRKLLMTALAILTFGAVIPLMPPGYLTRSGTKGNLPNERRQTDESEDFESGTQMVADLPEWAKSSQTAGTGREELLQSFSSYALKEVRKQGLHKFDSKIAAKIGDQYMNEIGPAFIQLIPQISSGHDRQWVSQLAVTHSPAPGFGERILHVYRKETGEELLKLHVRREHPPLEGYWFDFHYHTALDNFQKHHVLKRVYWGKNTPPKWRA